MGPHPQGRKDCTALHSFSPNGLASSVRELVICTSGDGGTLVCKSPQPGCVSVSRGNWPNESMGSTSAATTSASLSMFPNLKVGCSWQSGGRSWNVGPSIVGRAIAALSGGRLTRIPQGAAVRRQRPRHKQHLPVMLWLLGRADRQRVFPMAAGPRARKGFDSG